MLTSSSEVDEEEEEEEEEDATVFVAQSERGEVVSLFGGSWHIWEKRQGCVVRKGEGKEWGYCVVLSFL